VRNRLPRTHQALRCALDQWQRFSHRLCDRNAIARNRDRVEPERFVSLTQTACDCNDWHPGAPRGCGHSAGELPVAALPIDASLSGDDEVGARDSFGESDRTKDELRPGYKSCIEEREEARPESAGGSRSGHVADRPPDERLDDVGVSRERGIELADDLRRRAFLRPVHRGGAFWAEERIPNIARHFDRGTNEARVGLAIDPAEARERCAAFWKLVAVTIEKSVTEGARHPRAAVVRRASADADHDPMCAGGGSRKY
jgi:hypothetical protein